MSKTPYNPCSFQNWAKLILGTARFKPQTQNIPNTEKSILKTFQATLKWTNKFPLISEVWSMNLGLKLCALHIQDTLSYYYIHDSFQNWPKLICTSMFEAQTQNIPYMEKHSSDLPSNDETSYYWSPQVESTSNMNLDIRLRILEAQNF